MTYLKSVLVLLVLSLLITACAPSATPTATMMPTVSAPTPTVVVTPEPAGIMASDSGKTYQIGITSRISIILSQADYPEANLKVTCVPDGAMGAISNLPSVPAGFYALRYEGVTPGACTVSNGSFEVTILIENLPS